MGDDRRKDDNKIAVLEERVTNWMESTTEYRKDLCRKIDIITNKLGELPCKERSGWYGTMKARTQVTMWAVGLVLTVLGVLFMRGNGDRNEILADTGIIKKTVNQIDERVKINTSRVDKLDIIHNILPK